MNDFRFCGHPLEPAELALIVELATRYGRLSRHELAQTVCELLDWHRPNGRPKTIECRALLKRMQEEGRIALPALKPGRPPGAHPPVPVRPDPETGRSGARSSSAIIISASACPLAPISAT